MVSEGEGYAVVSEGEGMQWWVRVRVCSGG